MSKSQNRGGVEITCPLGKCMMIQEHRLLLETADSIHERITQVQKAAMEFHEDLHRLGAKEGLKRRKLHKAVENFAWNITVLKGQGDPLPHPVSLSVSLQGQGDPLSHPVSLSNSLQGQGDPLSHPVSLFVSLQGQGDLLRSAKAEALDSLKQLELACLSCGLSQPEDGKARRGQKSIKERESGEGNRRI
ncbi:UNVERIFIED_CONTAM: hypothetical protein FKN15_072690 [Acipenser sinensis]